MILFISVFRWIRSIAANDLDDLWPNPLQYYLVPDIEVETEENDNSAEECEDEEQANDVELGANDGRTEINSAI